MESLSGEKSCCSIFHGGKKIKLYDYIKQPLGMYSGELQSVSMRLPNNMVGTVLDCFGREI